MDTYKIMWENRNTGNWLKLWTKEPMTLEQAQAEFSTFEYNSDYVNCRIVSEQTDEILRDWLKEQKG